MMKNESSLLFISLQLSQKERQMSWRRALLNCLTVTCTSSQWEISAMLSEGLLYTLSVYYFNLCLSRSAGHEILLADCVPRFLFCILSSKTAVGCRVWSGSIWSITAAFCFSFPWCWILDGHKFWFCSEPLYLWTLGTTDFFLPCFDCQNVD